MKNVTIVKTGVANLASVVAGFKRIGFGCNLSNSPTELESAELVVMPGVGAFGAAMTELHSAHLVPVLQQRVKRERPLLCICLGLQLLSEQSEETPGVSGLAVVPATVQKFKSHQSVPCKVPQLGWNRIQPDGNTVWLQEGFAYFANSYALFEQPENWSVAWAEYAGSKFVAAMERGPLLACQFHPELSSNFGLELLSRWAHESRS